MSITANNIDRKSWLEVPVDTDFPIQNIPFGVFLTKENVVTVGTRIGDFAIDLGALQQLNYFEGIELTDDMFLQDTLNDFISDGKRPGDWFGIALPIFLTKKIQNYAITKKIKI